MTIPRARLDEWPRAFFSSPCDAPSPSPAIVLAEVVVVVVVVVVMAVVVVVVSAVGFVLGVVAVSTAQETKGTNHNL